MKQRQLFVLCIEVVIIVVTLSITHKMAYSAGQALANMYHKEETKESTTPKEDDKNPKWVEAFPGAEFSLEGKATATTTTTPMGVPAVLKINGESWRVVEVKSFADYPTHAGKDVEFIGTGANTNCDKRIIAYVPPDNGKSNDVSLRDAIMHEVFHAGGCIHGGDEYWNSISPTTSIHPGVKHLGEFMSEFIRMNPEFIDWISE